MKTVVLGFDALDFRYLDRFESSLPNLRRLRDRGLEAPLASTHPPWTGSAWPSMYTGTDPSHHGVYGFFDYDGYPDDGTLVSRSDVRRPALWNYVTSDGGRSVVLNVPITHPAESIDGALIPGYLAAEDEPGHPVGIRDELADAMGEEYTIYSRGELSDDPDEKFEGYLDLVENRRRAAVALLEREEWELAVIQVQKTDAVFHNFDDPDRHRAIYVAADRLAGDVLETVGDDVNVVLCSDHGMGPVTGYGIHVNEILREHGFVAATDEGEAMSMKAEKASLIGAEEGPAGDAADGTGGTATVLERTLHAGRRAASRVGIEPADVYAAAERVGLEEALLRVVPDGARSAASESIDWRASKAYCPDGMRMGVRINLEGREPDGVVPPAEYERVRDEIIELLSGLETPDGEPAFEFVRRREELFGGPYRENAPDVCFLPTDMNHTVSSGLYGRRFVPVETHNHKRDGVFVGAGPGFADATPERLSLPDVGPIVMGLLDRPIPAVMTGSVPEGLLVDEPPRTEYGDVPYGDSAADRSTDDERVTERLEDLGYL
ncbi:alkaline phosphatase family protein [Natrinema thermotolerans]